MITVSKKLPALRDTFMRQTTIGNLIWIFLAIWILMPYSLDKWRNEPSISTALTLRMEDGEYIVGEYTQVKYPNRGLRNNILLDEKGRIMCAKNWVSFWNKNLTLFWHLPAFVGCEAPNVPFRVCSIFYVYTKSGIEREFGDKRDFCTQMMHP